MDFIQLSGCFNLLGPTLLPIVRSVHQAKVVSALIENLIPLLMIEVLKLFVVLLLLVPLVLSSSFFVLFGEGDNVVLSTFLEFICMLVFVYENSESFYMFHFQWSVFG